MTKLLSSCPSIYVINDTGSRTIVTSQSSQELSGTSSRSDIIGQVLSKDECGTKPPSSVVIAVAQAYVRAPLHRGVLSLAQIQRPPWVLDEVKGLSD